MNLGELISRSAQHYPDRIALQDDRATISFKQLDERTNQLANALTNMGVVAGDKVAILAWNRSEIVEVEMALYKAGLVRVPINARLSDEEVVQVCIDSQAEVLITDAAHKSAAKLVMERCENVHLLSVIDSFKECMENFKSSCFFDYESLINKASKFFGCKDVSSSDLAVLHYTSGSSGVLKAAMQTFGNRLAMLHKMVYRIGLRPDVHETCLHVAPITHVSGMSLLALLSKGNTNIIMSRFDAEQVLKTIQDMQVSHVYLVPTMINRILALPNKSDYQHTHLKMVRYGSAPIAPTRLKEAIEYFGPILDQGYGAGETCSSVTVLTGEDHAAAINGKPHLLASCGRAIFSTQVDIVDEEGNKLPIGEQGELVIKGPDVMVGYWNAQELTDQVLRDGYYHTGDVAYMDKEGYIYLVDRLKDMVVSGGFNVYPNEVERVLYKHPSVYEACVVGVPDIDLGEAIQAVVVLKDKAVANEIELTEHCRDHLAKFKLPKRISFVEELPKNGNGKIQRREVKDAFWQNQDRRV